jgi:hypothetical protein
MYPRLAARARNAAGEGFAAATIEIPGSGDRPRSADAEEARADLHRPLEAGERVDGEIVDRLVLPLVERRSRNGGPPWTPSFRCPRSAARSGTREG